MHDLMLIVNKGRHDICLIELSLETNFLDDMSSINFNKYFSLVFVVFFFACTQKEIFNGEVKTIELKESKDFLPISSFISKLDYLELQVSQAKIQVGEIQDIKVIAGDLIVKQRKAGEISFLRFAKNGEFLNEILNNKDGKVANPLDIIQYKSGFAILGEKGIHEVSKEGKYMGKIISSEMAGESFFTANNRFYVIDETDSNDFLVEYSEKGKANNTARLDQRFDKLIYSDVAIIGKQDYHLVSSFSDVIYSYSKNKLVPKYKLDGGDYSSLNEVWQNVGDRDTKEAMRYIYDIQYVLVKNYLENDEFIFMTYWVGSSSTTVIIKKADWEIRYYGRGVNDIDGGVWDKALYLSNDNELYIPLSAGKISGHIITNKYHQDFEKLQIHIAATGNPVIMRCVLE